MYISETKPTLTILHPNGKGTGSAVTFQLFRNCTSPDKTKPVGGFIRIRMAKQKTISDYRANPQILPTFDWETAIQCDCGFTEIAKMLQVFRGETESIDDNRGLWCHDKPQAIKLTLRHLIDPVCGYALNIYCSDDSVGQASEINILLTNAESLGLCEVFASSFRLIAFGE